MISSFNAHHSPIGAFAGFILGNPGQQGGFSLEMGAPPRENIYIGAEAADTPNLLEALPFFKGEEDADRERYELESKNEEPMPTTPTSTGKVVMLSEDKIHRDFQLGTDTWQAGDLTFRILSQVSSVPDPAEAKEDELKQVLVPAVLAELTLDNTGAERDRKVFFGYQGSDRYTGMRQFRDDATGLKGIGQGRITAIVSKDEGVVTGQGFEVEDVVAPFNPANRGSGIAPNALLVGVVPAGTTRTFSFAICFYRGGIATTGMEAAYYYSRFFNSIEDVGNYALANFDALKKRCEACNDMVTASSLSDDRKFMLAHAIRSYYGSSELLVRDGQPLWVVNEGEYRMMNTFDLTADHLYFELHMNPWVMRNALDLFVDRYSYYETAHFHGDDTEYPGGISFTHDMGVANNFSRPGHSSYELFGLSECFSHMTHEQLVNWVLCASLYGVRTDDDAWMQGKQQIFKDCLKSMVNRDHPDPTQRNGIMALDSSRTVSEITTYDSLDISLGQARNNLYLAVKTWAAYISLETVLNRIGQSDSAGQAAEQARRTAATVASKADADGMLPAVFEKGNTSKIISAVEGLAFPWLLGRKDTVSETGPYAELVRALRTHLEAVLKPGVCLFPDGGWKLSSTSNNSWLSKIYLGQFVAERILGIEDDRTGLDADAAHVAWLTDRELSYWCWSDQIVSGKIRGSKYYPRGVTSILWLYG